MYFEENALKKFYVLEGIENGVTVTDGLLAYDVEISNDDITNILKEKFGITPKDMEDLLKHYELHEDEIVREHIKLNDWWDFKNYVQDFYDDMKDFDFIDFDSWSSAYCGYWLGIDVDDDNNAIFKLDYDGIGIECFEIDDGMYSFDSNIENLKDELKDLQYLQNDLTVRADDYRERLLDNLNDNLKMYDLKEIPIKKYKDETEVVNTIKEINSDSPEDLELFLEDYNPKNNYILSDEGDVYISLVRDKEGDYYTFDDYHDDGDVIDTIRVEIQDILTTDDILYQPGLKECKDIDDKFYYKDKRRDYAWER